MTSSATTTVQTTKPTSPGRAVYAILIGLTALGVLLQGLWAGIFLEGDTRSDRWVNVHARGAELTILICILALVAALIWLRRRRDVVIGTGILTASLIIEAYLGGRITDNHNDTLTAIHVPLAMLVMDLAVWLPIRVTRSAAATVR